MDRTPIAYPIMFVINFFVAILLGGIMFALYLYYLSNHHFPRTIKHGELCPELHAAQCKGGKYSPLTYPPPDLRPTGPVIHKENKQPGFLF